MNMAIEEKIEKDVTLAPFTTFKIGGPAKYFVEADSPDELIEAIRWAKAKCEKFFVLGGGSNLLVGDNGFNGLVIKNVSGRIFRQNIRNGCKASCDSGLPLARVVQSAIRNSLTGMEWAVGVPGTVGGAVRGNAGAYGMSMQDIVESVTVYKPDTDETIELATKDCGFMYRHSSFKENNWVVLSCVINLMKGNEGKIAELIGKYAKSRRDSQPKYPCAGSIFKNIPTSEIDDNELIEEAKNDGVIRNDKLSAGWLISKLYFKGKEVGGAMVSHEHANFIVNKSFNATASDVMMLISMIKQKVRVEYNIQLHEEVQYLDF